MDVRYMGIHVDCGFVVFELITYVNTKALIRYLTSIRNADYIYETNIALF